MTGNRDESTPTIAYYDSIADEYASDTLSISLDGLLKRFLSYVPDGLRNRRILDLGCGSGRDSKAIIDLGWDVLPVDGSAEMCRIASDVTGRLARRMLFSEMDFHGEFAGIWASASLLHVPAEELPDILARCRDAIVLGGILYMSFQMGAGEEVRHGCHYTDLMPDTARHLVNSCDGLEVLDVILTNGATARRPNLRWVNVFACRVEVPQSHVTGVVLETYLLLVAVNGVVGVTGARHAVRVSDVIDYLGDEPWCDVGGHVIGLGGVGLAVCEVLCLELVVSPVDASPVNRVVADEDAGEHLG